MFRFMIAMLAALVVGAAPLAAQSSIQQVVDDARTIGRVADVSRRDLPQEVLRRIATEDLEFLRMKNPDGTYQYARYEREEADRIEESFSVRTDGRDLNQKTRFKGDYVYRLIIQAPMRRLLIAKNRRVYLERVDLEFQPLGGSPTLDTRTFGEWLEPGVRKTIDLPAVARNLNVVVYTRLDEKSGSANLDMTLLRARVSDNPYAVAVQNVKAILRAVETSDRASIRSLAASLQGSLPNSQIPLAASISAVPPSDPKRTALETDELQRELRLIEDALTGSPEERRGGLDRLHQLIRRLRPLP